MLTVDMTAEKCKLNYNCLSLLIMTSGLQDVVQCTVAKCEQYIGLHTSDDIYY